MPKLKTHSGAKKRFRTSSKGKVRAKRAGMKHNLAKKSSKSKLQKRALTTLKKSDEKVIKKLLLSSMN